MHRNVATVLVLSAALWATPATGQPLWDGLGFVTVGVGVQAPSRDFEVRSAPVIYGEPGSISAAQSVGTGVLFDVGGGRRVWRSLVVGLTYSYFGDSSGSAVAAAIPHPRFRNSHRAATAAAGDLGHSEHALHFVATWMIPFIDKVDIGIFGGPSVFFVSQDVVSDIGFSESPDFASVTLGAPVVTGQDETAVGVNVGAEMTYTLKPRYGLQYGVTGYLKYAGASAELADLDGGDLDVGGLQLGVGIRVRF
jgi:hypothetical protein